MELPSPKTILEFKTHPIPTKRRSGVWAWLGAIGLIVVGAGIISYPLWPKIEYAVSKPRSVFPYETKLNTNAGLNKQVTLTRLPDIQNKPKPKGNRLVIPSINVDMPILEGPTEKTLDLGGIWHIPNTANPTIGSNTVLSGHRWQYLPPSGRTLYLLDKVKVGEPIIIYWKGKEYDYHVDRREIVNPSQVEILNPTGQPQLTIFTCTPLYSTSHRLVLFASLIT